MEAISSNKCFLLQKMCDSIEIVKKDSKLQNEISQTIEEHNNETFAAPKR